MQWLEVLSPLSSNDVGATPKLSPLPWLAAQAAAAPDLTKSIDLNAELDSFGSYGTERQKDVAPPNDQAFLGVESTPYQPPWNLSNAGGSDSWRWPTPASNRSSVPSPSYEAGFLTNHQIELADPLETGTCEAVATTAEATNTGTAATGAGLPADGSLQSPLQATASPEAAQGPAYDSLLDAAGGALASSTKELQHDLQFMTPAGSHQHALPMGNPSNSTASVPPTSSSDKRQIRVVDYTPSPLPNSTPLPRSRPTAGWGWRAAAELAVSTGKGSGSEARQLQANAFRLTGSQTAATGLQQSLVSGSGGWASASRRSTHDMSFVRPEPSWASTEADVEADHQATPATREDGQVTVSLTSGASSSGKGSARSSSGRHRLSAPSASHNVHSPPLLNSSGGSVDATPVMSGGVGRARTVVDPAWAALWASTASSLHLASSPGGASPPMAAGLQQTYHAMGQQEQTAEEPEVIKTKVDVTDSSAVSDAAVRWRDFMQRSASEGPVDAGAQSPDPGSSIRGGGAETAALQLPGCIQEYLTPVGSAAQTPPDRTSDANTQQSTWPQLPGAIHQYMTPASASSSTSHTSPHASLDAPASPVAPTSPEVLLPLSGSPAAPLSLCSSSESAEHGTIGQESQVNCLGGGSHSADMEVSSLLHRVMLLPLDQALHQQSAAGSDPLSLVSTQAAGATEDTSSAGAMNSPSPSQELLDSNVSDAQVRLVDKGSDAASVYHQEVQLCHSPAAASNVGPAAVSTPSIAFSPPPWATPVGNALLLGSPLEVAGPFQALNSAPEDECPLHVEPFDLLGAVLEYRTPVSIRHLTVPSSEPASNLGSPASGCSMGSMSSAGHVSRTYASSLASPVRHLVSPPASAAKTTLSSASSTIERGQKEGNDDVEESGQGGDDENGKGSDLEGAEACGPTTARRSTPAMSSQRRSPRQTAVIARALARVKQLSREGQDKEQHIASLLAQLSAFEAERSALATALQQALRQLRPEQVEDQGAHELHAGLSAQLQELLDLAEAARAHAAQQKSRADEADRALTALQQHWAQQEAHLHDQHARLQQEQAMSHSVHVLELRVLMQRLTAIAGDMASTVHLPDARQQDQQQQQQQQQRVFSLGGLPPVPPSRGSGLSATQPSTPARAKGMAGQARWYEEVWAQDTLSQLIEQGGLIAARLNACLQTLTAPGDSQLAESGTKDCSCCTVGSQTKEHFCCTVGSQTEVADGWVIAQGMSQNGHTVADSYDISSLALGGDHLPEQDQHQVVQQTLQGVRTQCAQLDSAVAQQLACAEEVQLQVHAALQQLTIHVAPEQQQDHDQADNLAASESAACNSSKAEGHRTPAKEAEWVRCLRKQLYMERSLSDRRGQELRQLQTQLAGAQELLEQLGQSNEQALQKIHSLRVERDVQRQQGEALSHEAAALQQGHADLKAEVVALQKLLQQAEQVVGQQREQLCALQSQCEGVQAELEQARRMQGELELHNQQLAEELLAQHQLKVQQAEQEGQDAKAAVAQLQLEAEEWQRRLAEAEGVAAALLQQLAAAQETAQQQVQLQAIADDEMQARHAELQGEVQRLQRALELERQQQVIACQELQQALTDADMAVAAKSEELLGQTLRCEALRCDIVECENQKCEVLARVDRLEEKLGQSEVRAVQLEQELEELGEKLALCEARCEDYEVQAEAARVRAEDCAAAAAEAELHWRQANDDLRNAQATLLQAASHAHGDPDVTAVAMSEMQAALAVAECKATEAVLEQETAHAAHAAALQEVADFRAQMAAATQAQAVLQDAAARQLELQQADKEAQTSAVASALAGLLNARPGIVAASGDGLTDDCSFPHNTAVEAVAGVALPATTVHGASVDASADLAAAELMVCADAQADREAAAVEQLAHAEAEVGRLLALVQALQQEALATEDLVQTLRAEVAMLRADAGAMQDEAQAQRRSAVEAAEVARLTASSLSRLQAAFEAIGEERRRLAAELEEAEVRMHAAETARQAAEAALQVAEGARQLAVEARQVAEQQAAEAQVAMESAEAAAKQAQGALSEGQDALQVAHQEAQRLAAEAEAAALACHAAEAATATATGRLAEVQAQLQAAESRCQAAEEEASRLARDLLAAKQALEDLERQALQREEQLRGQEAEAMARWEARIAAHREEQRSLQCRAADAEAEAATAHTAAADAERRVMQVTEAAAAQEAALSARIEAYEARLKAPGHTGPGLVEGLAAAVSRLQADLDEAESRLEAVEGQTVSGNGSVDGAGSCALQPVNRYQDEVQQLQQHLSRAQLRIAALAAKYEEGEHVDDLDLDHEQHLGTTANGNPQAVAVMEQPKVLSSGELRSWQQEGLWRQLHDMLLEDTQRDARRRRRQQREQQHDATDQTANVAAQNNTIGQADVAAGGQQLAVLHDDVQGSQPLVAESHAGLEEAAMLQHAWERGDRVLLLQAAVRSLHVLRQQHRSMARLLRRVEREGPVQGRLEALHQENKDLLCKYLTTQAAQRQYESVVRRLSQENTELVALVTGSM